MSRAGNAALQFGKRIRYENVYIQLDKGNCCGIIGADGAGRGRFLKRLSGELQPTSGEVIASPGERVSALRRDHFFCDGFDVLTTVIRCNQMAGPDGKVRAQLAQALFGNPDILQPNAPNHLDLESITSPNNGMTAFKGTMIFAFGHRLVSAVANRMDLSLGQPVVDKRTTYDEYFALKLGD